MDGLKRELCEIVDTLVLGNYDFNTIRRFVSQETGETTIELEFTDEEGNSAKRTYPFEYFISKINQERKTQLLSKLTEALTETLKENACEFLNGFLKSANVELQEDRDNEEIIAIVQATLDNENEVVRDKYIMLSTSEATSLLSVMSIEDTDFGDDGSNLTIFGSFDSMFCQVSLLEDGLWGIRNG